MTIIGAVPREDVEEPVAEATPDAPEAEPEDEPGAGAPAGGGRSQAEQDGRRRWWRRREEEEVPEPVLEPPRHVRVLESGERDDPWEQGFDAPVTAEAEEVGDDEAPELVEGENSRRIFRRR